MASLEDFLKGASEDSLELFTQDHLLQLAPQYDVTVPSSEKRLKDSVKEIVRSDLINKGVLKVKPASLPSMTAPLSEGENQLRLKD